MSRVEAQVLNLLPPSGSATVRDLRDALPSFHPALKRLVFKRLVEHTKDTRPGFIRLTRAGAEHEQYRRDASHLPAVNEDSRLKPEKVKLLLALEALGEARAMDLTAVAGLKRPAKGAGTGQWLSELKRSGLIAQDRKPGVAPVYRLTVKGAALVAPAHLDSQRTSPRDARKAVQRAASKRAAQALARGMIGGGGTGRTNDILAIIKQAGRISAYEIHERLPKPFKDPHSLNVALKDLKKRGQVVSVGGGPRQFDLVWSLARNDAS